MILGAIYFKTNQVHDWLHTARLLFVPSNNKNGNDQSWWMSADSSLASEAPMQPIHLLPPYMQVVALSLANNLDCTPTARLVQGSVQKDQWSNGVCVCDLIVALICIIVINK